MSDEIGTRLDAISAQMAALAQQHAEQVHSHQMREWEPFLLHGGGVTVNGSATVAFRARQGYEWRVGRIAVSVGGASSAANVTVYVTEADALSGTAADDISMADFEVGFFGSSPSRAVADQSSPIYVTNGAYMLVAVTSAAAGSNNVSVRIEGERRQV